ncbi:MAG: hypothetical protein IJC26_00635 [Clostridia bacterium]|nr:hypothetical protein [Clostridia bacterium]
MKKTEKTTSLKKRMRRKRALCSLAIVCVLVLVGVAGGILFSRVEKNAKKDDKNAAKAEAEQEASEVLVPEKKRETGFLSYVEPSVTVCDETGESVGTLPRGSRVQYEVGSDGRTEIFSDDLAGFLPEGAAIVADTAQAVPVHTLYVRTALNLRTAEGKLLDTFAEKGNAVDVVGCDYVNGEGQAHMYRVKLGEAEGYIMPWYLVSTREEALANYDNGSYAVHAGRGNRYGGGEGADPDYFPREKGSIEGNVMPEECRALYIATWCIDQVDAYIAAAAGSGINSFVVDIADSGAVGYSSEVMKQYCPSAAAAAKFTPEEYKAAIQKLKDAGYYVIGRITTFNDTYFIKDHPECAIADGSGNPLTLSGEHWPTAFNRMAWQYKVDLAVDAAKLMGFNEIQFDYVRFPDRTSRYEKAGTIDFRNTYGETKVQAIQRFLMYATDILHENGVYVSADVYGESAYTYITAYGQYWPAISNVVDVISGMPYPDHFAANGTWLPWEHPYETLNKWGKNVMLRQGETATPAKVRTWIQAYNAIQKPYNTYGPEEISAQIKGLRDAGCTGGYMTWNAASSLEKYKKLMPAFSV